MKSIRKTVEVKPDLWDYLRSRAKRNGRTVYGEIGVILEALKKRDKNGCNSWTLTQTA
jgi:hypothetical protein